MGENSENNVTLAQGMWACPHMKRLELALKIKEIPFEYVEEDLSNKSVLRLNSDHILVHNGKPICESRGILEYINKTWPDNGPNLLPKDPYQRARVRFWAAYIEQMQPLNKITELFYLDKDARKKAMEEIYESQRILEEGLVKDLFPDGIAEVHAEKLGILDINLAVTFGTYQILEEVLGVKVLDPQKNPFIFSWVEALTQLPVVKEVVPPREKLVALFEFVLKRGIN